MGALGWLGKGRPGLPGKACARLLSCVSVSVSVSVSVCAESYHDHKHALLSGEGCGS